MLKKKLPDRRQAGEAATHPSPLIFFLLHFMLKKEAA